MRRHIRTRGLVASLVLAGAAVAGAQVKPTALYGTSTPSVNGAPFAIATTPPPSGQTRSEFVVAAEEDAAANLLLLAWQDTTTALSLTSHHGTLAIPGGLASFAITGLDAHHVVTAAADGVGALSIDTWTVDAGGVTRLRGFKTKIPQASTSMSLTKAGPRRVVLAYATPSKGLAVQAWKIAADGLPEAEAGIGAGPLVAQVSIATVNPGLVITASSDAAGTMYVTTWAVNPGGVLLRDQAVFSGTVDTRPQAIAVGAGRALDANGNVVQSAFTPFVSPALQVDVFYWSVANNGLLTQQTTPTPTLQGDFFQVAAAMLPANIPMTAYGGGTGDNYIFAEWYTGGFLIDPNLEQLTFGPENLNSIGLVAAGASHGQLPQNSDYFVLAADYGPAPSPTGMLYIEILSVPESNPSL